MKVCESAFNGFEFDMALCFISRLFIHKVILKSPNGEWPFTYTYKIIHDNVVKLTNNCSYCACCSHVIKHDKLHYKNATKRSKCLNDLSEISYFTLYLDTKCLTFVKFSTLNPKLKACTV